MTIIDMLFNDELIIFFQNVHDLILYIITNTIGSEWNQGKDYVFSNFDPTFLKSTYITVDFDNFLAFCKI